MKPLQNLFVALRIALVSLFVIVTGSTRVSAKTAYVSYRQTGTLVFYYDDMMSTRPTTYTLDYNSMYQPDWINENILNVEFDPSFDDYRPTYTSSWFFGQSQLQSITGIEYLHTDNVTEMDAMFAGCSALTELDLSGFNTHNVVTMRAMFSGCASLEHIYVSDGWDTSGLTTPSFYANIFENCWSLTGMNGTMFNSTITGKAYAHIDVAGNPGYLSYLPYAVVNDTDHTLTFYNNAYRNTHAGRAFTIPRGERQVPSWAGNATVMTAEFDASFAHVEPTSLHAWFKGLNQLGTIRGLENLNTSRVTDMSFMFYGCSWLNTFDFTNFDTSNVMDMDRMFMGCSNLTFLDLSSFNTNAVTNMNQMFQGCSNLNAIYVGTEWNTDAVEAGGYMYWLNMFEGCTNLIGGRGTSYSVSKTGVSYAHIDADNHPGYLSKPAYVVLSNDHKTLNFRCDFNRSQQSGTIYYLPTDQAAPQWSDHLSSITRVVFSDFTDVCPRSTRFWFARMENLATIENLNTLRTDHVTTMASMFQGCRLLTSLNLSTFNTVAVTNTNYMFEGCSALTTIQVSNTWDLSNVPVNQSFRMFYGCTLLAGGYGTTYDANHVDVTYAHADEADNPGYFTGTPVYAVLHNNKLTFYCDNESHPGSRFLLNSPGTAPAWSPLASSITSVVFDASFANARPVSTYEWFGGMSNLTSITDIQYLNTSQVTDMRKMFQSCSKLDSVVVSDFDTQKVTRMDNMFSGCSKLSSLNLTSFSTNSLQQIGYMFQNCSSLVTIYVSDTWNNTDLSGFDVFQGCVNLKGCCGTTYDASHVGCNYARYDDELTPGYFSSGEPYVVLTADSILTFYCDMKRETRWGEMFSLNSGNDTPEWSPDTNSPAWWITSVVFDPSFAHAHPTSTKQWFWNMERLSNISGMSYLHTNEVTNMQGMFSKCKKLTSIDLSTFNTANVEDMSAMFSGCESVTTLDLSSFNTSQVTDMSNMFYDCESLTTLNLSSFNTANVTNMVHTFTNCKSLTTLDLSSFNTANVTNMKYMFSYCRSLITLNLSSFNTEHVENMSGMFECCQALRSLNITTFDTRNVQDMERMFYTCTALPSLDLSSFNTAKVTDMKYMFNGCESLTMLDLSSFDTQNVMDMFYMFWGCKALSTIYVGVRWDVWDLSKSMFYGCESLVGCQGTKYSSAHTDGWYAHIDRGPSGPGYLSVAPYAVLSTDGHTLTFYADQTAHAGTRYPLNVDGGAPGWRKDGSYADVTNVVFDASFANVRPISTGSWFQSMSNLTSLTGIENLNTGKATNMSFMFDGCNGLTSLDLSSLRTDSATNMNGMFLDCTGLQRINISSFNTAKVQTMYRMFEGCTNLTTLDLGSFDTGRLTSMGSMFRNCSNLVAIYVGDDWNTTQVPNSSSYGVFEGCTKLLGMNGTAYNASHTNKDYARIDSPYTPGYLSLPVYAVLSGQSLVFYCDTKQASRQGIIYQWNAAPQQPDWYTDGRSGSVTEVTLDPSLAQVRFTSTSYWFYGMNHLTSITGLEHLNTSLVRYMDGMFTGCSALSTINVAEDWDLSAVVSSANMFTGCISLVGGNGTPYSSSHSNASYAHIDATGNPGYFTLGVSQSYVELSTDGQTLTFYCDLNRTQREGSTYDIPSGLQDWPTWKDYTYDVHTVVFHPSFSQARPVSTYAWFSDIYSIESVTGLENLNTSQVLSMQSMFNGCGSLTSLDLSSFDTQNVKDMQYMFGSCSSLTSLDLSSFNTRNVEKMNGMFCWSSELTALDLTSFSTPRVTEMAEMFSGCSNLIAIYVGDGWSTASVTNGYSMFGYCDKLVGGKGTAYSTLNDGGVEYAHVDDVGNPGFLTYKMGAYAMFDADNSMLTFYYDRNLAQREGEAYAVPMNGSFVPGWLNKEIETVEFHSSFAQARPVSTASWFRGMDMLTSLVGMENLNTSQVTSMQQMFDNCISLTSPNLTMFDTGNVTNMQQMFNNCPGLITLDLTSFNTENVVNMGRMFAYCSDLVTIYVSNDWTTDALVGTSGGNENLFYNCTSLVGGNGTHFSTTYPHANYAHIDVAGNPGYLTFRNPLMPGDLNGDGVLSIADVTALVDVALGRDATQPYRFNHTAGDIDGDTQITMADVRVLVDMVLGQ